MSSRTGYSIEELNAAALAQFVRMPTSRGMVSYLAKAASNVIMCDPNMMPPPPQHEAYSKTPSKAIRCNDNGLPSLEEFITRVAISSTVQVPTLMSTLVYLTRLKSRLQPMAKGLRCTTHRIFLAALILASKYLNDSSPKNKHWATFSQVKTDEYNFGFTRTEVNLMEKQLLFLLDWELRITEEDLYRELEPFLAPIRNDIQAKHTRHMQRLRQKEEEAAALSWSTTRFPSPPTSRASSRSPSPRKESTIRMVSTAASASTPPPELTYGYGSSASCSGSSYASSLSSRQHSRSSTPLSDPETELHMAYMDSSLYESPVQIVLEMPPTATDPACKSNSRSKKLLPYEISVDDLHRLQDGGSNTKRARTGRGVWNRMFGTQA